MSLFGSSTPKPLFGSTSTPTSTAFSIGTNPTTTSSLFGSSTTTTTPKPLFGSTPQASTTTSLFGSPATTTSTGLFGSTTTTTASSGGLFGSNTSGSLFSKRRFGEGASTSTSGGMFGTSSGSGSLLTKPATTGFGTVPAGSSLFGAKPTGGGLFGAPAQQQSTEVKDTLQGILQNSDALVRSLTRTELFGDDRDEIIARLNQLGAALGTGGGYHKAEQPPVPYTVDGPFHRMKAIGYNRTSEYSDSDGIVALIIKCPHTELATSVQKQKLIDSLYIILGSKPTVHSHIESIKPLSENSTEVCIYVTEKFRGRISSKELAQYLNQTAQKQQLETQLKVDKDRIVSRLQMGKQQKMAYLKDPPPGFDAALWAQAVRENPDQERLIPYPIRGFIQLRSRQKAQIEEVAMENQVLDAISSRLSLLETHNAAATVRMAQQKVVRKQLSHRLLRILAMQLLTQRFSHGIDLTEERIQTALESINARINAPQQIKSRIADISEILQAENEAVRNQANTDRPHILGDSDVVLLKKYLARCQDGLESLVAVVNANISILETIAAAIES
uniref:Nup54 domain-containing protein n=1 Tax=Heterorhabditis bacteriophora TaxID=37862 RepID=A0A1I7XRR5_HETBA